MLGFNCSSSYIDGSPIGDRINSSLGGVLVDGVDIDALAPGYCHEPVVLATFDFHCSVALADHNRKPAVSEFTTVSTELNVTVARRDRSIDILGLMR